MAKFISHLCGCLADTMLLIGRATIFICCVLLGINQTAWLLSPHKADDANNKGTELAEKSYRGYIVAGFLLGASLIGIHGTWTRDPKHLRIFALIIMILSLFRAATIYNKYVSFNSEKLKLEVVLARAQTRYSWHEIDVNTATTLWDTAQQTLRCCGLNSWTDWDQFRPDSLGKDVLPGSCCSNMSRSALPDDGLCHAGDAFKVGCVDQYDKLEKTELLILAGDVFFYVMLAMLAISVAKNKDTRNNPAASQYTRFEGSVYVRRPDQTVGPSNSYQKPPAYAMASAPPPSYTLP